MNYNALLIAVLVILLVFFVAAVVLLIVEQVYEGKLKKSGWTVTPDMHLYVSPNNDLYEITEKGEIIDRSQGADNEQNEEEE